MGTRERRGQKRGGKIGLLFLIAFLAWAVASQTDISFVSNLVASGAPASSAEQLTYQQWIKEEAQQNGLSSEDEEALIRVAACESSWNPRAVNPKAIFKGEHASGLFQFIPSTWARTPQGAAGASIWDPHAQIQAVAWAWANGWRDQWECR